MVFTSAPPWTWSGAAGEDRASVLIFFRGFTHRPFAARGCRDETFSLGALAAINFGHALQIQAGLRPRQDGWSCSRIPDGLFAIGIADASARIARPRIGARESLLIFTQTVFESAPVFRFRLGNGSRAQTA